MPLGLDLPSHNLCFSAAGTPHLLALGDPYDRSVVSVHLDGRNCRIEWDAKAVTPEALRAAIAHVKSLRFSGTLTIRFKAGEWEMEETYQDHNAAFAAPEENCRCTAPSARMLANHVCYSGVTWFHPDYRGRDLASLLPRISRTLALGLWQTDYTLSLVERVLIEKGIVGRYGYKNVEPRVDWTGSPIHGDLYLHLIWMDRPTLLQDLAARTESTEEVRGARSKRQPEPALH